MAKIIGYTTFDDFDKYPERLRVEIDGDGIDILIESKSPTREDWRTDPEAGLGCNLFNAKELLALLQEAILEIESKNIE